MEESGSEGLDALLIEQLKPEGFFDSVDYVCISDNYWLGTTKPCITYGLRGISYYFLEVECAKMDLHSGVYGGTVHEGEYGNITQVILQEYFFCCYAVLSVGRYFINGPLSCVLVCFPPLHVASVANYESYIINEHCYHGLNNFR